jgi:uncharacterized protein involved in oxidation of intracellular sulfur
MRYLFVLNDPPYGTERSFSAIRHTRELLKDAGVEMRVFRLKSPARTGVTAIEADSDDV